MIDLTVYFNLETETSARTHSHFDHRICQAHLIRCQIECNDNVAKTQSVCVCLFFGCWVFFDIQQEYLCALIFFVTVAFVVANNLL